MKPLRNLLAGAFGLLLAASLALSSPALAQVPSQFVNAQTGTTYTFLNTDQSKLVTLSNASAVAVTLPRAGNSDAFNTGWYTDVENRGVGAVTITPTTSTIDGAATLVLTQNQGVRIVSDGTNYQVQRGGARAGLSCTSSGSTPQTCNGASGVATTNSLSTAHNASASYTVANSAVSATSVVLCTIVSYAGTISTNGVPVVTQCVPGSGSFVVNIFNADDTNALSGAVGIGFQVLN